MRKRVKKIELFKLFGTVSLNDEMTQKLKNIDQKAKSVGQRLNNVGKSISNTGKNMTKYVTAPIFGIGTAMFGLATKVGNTADRLLDLSDITGMTTDTLQEYEYVAKIAGVSTEAVSRATEGLIRRLPQLKNEGGVTGDAIKELGVSVEGTADEIMDNLILALSETEDVMDRNAKGSAIFGGAWKDLAPILGMGAEGIEEVRREARELGIVMSEEALNSANEFRVGLDRLKAMFGGLFNDLGTKFAPVLNDVLIPLIQDSVIPVVMSFADRVGRLIDRFTDLSPEMQMVALAMIGVVASMGPALLVIGKLIPLVGVITTAIGGAGGLGAVLTALTGPIGIVVISVMTLIAIFVSLYKNNEEFREKVTKLWDSIKEMFSSVFSFIMSVVDVFVSNFQNLWEKYGDNIQRIISSALEIIMSSFGTTFDLITDIFNVFSALFKGDWRELWDSVKTLFINLFDNILYLFESYFDSIKAIFELFKNVITSIWGSVWDGIKTTTINVFDSISETVSSWVGSVKSVISAFGNALGNMWEKIWDGVRNTTKNAVNNIIGSINNMIQRATNAINSMSSALSKIPGVNIPKVSAPKIPGLYKGGILEKSGSVLVGERGPEFLDLPRGAKVTPLNKAKEQVKNIINVTISGNTLLNDRDADRLGEVLVGRLKSLGVV